MVRFGELPIKARFLFQGVEYIKINEGYGQTVQGKRRVEFAYNVKVMPI